jgi:hypothetical protein
MVVERNELKERLVRLLDYGVGPKASANARNGATVPPAAAVPSETRA